MAKYDTNAMPVVNEAGELLGVITIDDIVDVLTAEQTEDVQMIGGIAPLEVPYFQTSFFAFLRKRGVWLLVLFFLQFFTQFALRSSDHVLSAIQGAAYYVPLLIDQDLDFALTVGVSIVGIVFAGCTIGAMLPLLLRRFGIDPATSSTPFIASLVDVTGILIFVFTAQVIMSQVIAAYRP
jgi:magnesium transporter